ncbi:hypothetical protein WH47_03047 [Habropoda laboriosa]|uniref:Uncharacterized protein n=1 Tax=Habropoda laboriosa TaxID=597456 RepID=A0A0L7QT40_9HYME|nr:hypothetical protein WH47_03047 [Habropoda laboriosa]
MLLILQIGSNLYRYVKTLGMAFLQHMNMKFPVIINKFHYTYKQDIIKTL